MTTSNKLKLVTSIAGEAIPTYRFVELQADSKYDLASTQGMAHGVSDEAADADDDAFAMSLMLGQVKVEAGASITAGDDIGSDSTGRAITAVASVDNVVLGIAMGAAGGAGEIVTIQLFVRVDAGS